jgi:hypothetical protein
MDTHNPDTPRFSAGAAAEGLSGLAEWINLTHALMQLKAGDAAIASSRRERLLALELVACDEGQLILTPRGRKAIGLRR